MKLTTAERSRLYRQLHPEKVREYLEKNREKAKVRAKAWYYAHHEQAVATRKKYAQAHPDIMHKAWKKWYAAHPEIHGGWIDRWKNANPEKKRAHGIIHTAIKRGTIERPDSCSKCNKKCKPDAHHHMGYEDPFVFQWLCRKCHKDIHLRERGLRTELS